MNKNKLLFFPFFVGLLLLGCSWYLSYPLTIDHVNDFAFNHISVLYWIGLPLVLSSLYLALISTKNPNLQWILSASIVAMLFSSSYLYYRLPGSDSHYFRGLTEYFSETKNLDPLQDNHNYLQWPHFFIFNSISTSVSGLDLISFEFLLYAVIGFLFSTTLYVYTSKLHKNTGALAVVTFFISIFSFFNYQFAPFSFAFALLFVLFMLETRKRTASITLTILILFTFISMSHAFVAVFFVLYLLIQRIYNRDKRAEQLFVLTLIIYVIVQLSFAYLNFPSNVINVLMAPSRYASQVTGTLELSQVPFDLFAQNFSRAVIVSAMMICVLGFIIMFFKRKLRGLDKAIFITGAIYLFLGVFLNSLGERAIGIIFIPLSLGASFLFESKLGRYLKYLFLILLILFLFVPVHASFYDSPINFQTKEQYVVGNFMIEEYNWSSNDFIFSDNGIKWYIYPQIDGNTIIKPGGLPVSTADFDCVIYSVGLAKTINYSNVSEAATLEFLHNEFNIIYNSGKSIVAKEFR